MFNGKNTPTNSEIFKFGEALGSSTFFGVVNLESKREGGGPGAYACERRHFAQGEGRSLGEWRIGVFLVSPHHSIKCVKMTSYNIKLLYMKYVVR
jgi:hypothetical protein